MYYLLENQHTMGRLVVLDSSDGVVETMRADIVCNLCNSKTKIKGMIKLDGKWMCQEVPVPVDYVKPKQGQKIVTRVTAETHEYFSRIYLSGVLYGSSTPFKDVLNSRDTPEIYDNHLVGNYFIADNLDVFVDNYYRGISMFHEYRNGRFSFKDTENDDYHTNIGDEVNFISWGDFLVKYLRKGIVKL